jgi:hypothetical protein
MWCRLPVHLGIALALSACNWGPLGTETGDEDHRFLIDLRNISLSPVTIRIAGEPSGFLVQGISVTTIQRSAEPGQDLVFEALLEGGTSPVHATSCRYSSPSDGDTRRRVSWNGAALQCLGW